MKTMKLIFSLLMAMNAAQAKIDLTPEMVVEKIAPDTYVATDKAYFWANTMIAKAKDGTVVLASSPYENVGTQRLMDWIRKTLHPKKIIAINTHFHLDGTGGNEVYKREGVETWASDRTKELQSSEGPKVVQETLANYTDPKLKQRILDSKFIAADNIFPLKSGKQFTLKGLDIQVYFPGEAHSPDNVVVYLKERKILFGGCMIKPQKDLGYLRDANVKTWADSAKNLEKFDVRIVVPGHGPWGGKDFIAKTIANALKAQQ